jgi:hypothetical protein
VTEAEIVHLGIPFGRVTNVLVLKGKNQVRGVRDAFFFVFFFPFFELSRSSAYGPPAMGIIIIISHAPRFSLSKPNPLFLFTVVFGDGG